MRVKRGFTVMEVVLSTAIFSAILVVLLLAMRNVSGMTMRTHSRDEALAQVMKAKGFLLRDLGNSSARSNHWAQANVGPAPHDGAAVTFLSSGDGSGSGSWSTDPNTGEATLGSQITYYLAIPNVANKYGIAFSAGPGDSQNYEQQYPLKWLVRRVDPPAAGPSVDANWTNWLTRPTGPINTSTRSVAANNLFQFKVLQGPPVWTFELSAVAIVDARRKLDVGRVPLTGTPYVVVERFSVTANNQ
jgi:hypothetical protein